MSPVNEYTQREWWSLGELQAEWLRRTGQKLHPNTMYRAIAKGRLPTAQKIFGAWRVHRDAVDTLLGTDAEDKRMEFTLDDDGARR